MDENSALLRTREAADRLRLCPETVRRHVASGKIPALRLASGQYRFKVSDLDALAEPRKVTA